MSRTSPSYPARCKSSRCGAKLANLPGSVGVAAKGKFHPVAQAKGENRWSGSFVWKFTSADFPHSAKRRATGS